MKLALESRQYKLIAMLFLMKIIYIFLVQLLLPETYLLWSFEKSVHIEFIFYELIPFFIGAFNVSVNYNPKSPLCFFSLLLMILYFIPTNSTLVLSSIEWEYYCLSNLFAILILCMISYLVKKDSIKYSYNEQDEDNSKVDSFLSSPKLWRIIRIICILVCVSNIVYVYKNNGLNFSRVFSDEMYEVRAEYAEYAASITGGLTSYLNLIVTKVSGWFLPLYLYFSLSKRRITDIVFSLFTFLANYSVEMQKNSLMIVGVVFFIYLVEKTKKCDSISPIFLKSFFCFFILSTVESRLFKESKIFKVFIRRMLYIPSYMNFKFYDFFSEHRKLMFTQDAFFLQNILSKLFGRAYDVSAVAVISKYKFNGELPSPNTGLFAEAYSQLGIIGIFVFPFIYAIIITIMYKKASFYGNGAIYIVLFKLALTMTSVFMLTSTTFMGILLFVVITTCAQISYQSIKV